MPHRIHDDRFRRGSGMSRRAVAAVVAGAVLYARAAAAADRAELLMFDEAGCPWCARWRAEVGPGYAASPEGKRAPLRTIPLRNGVPPGLKLARPVNATPTFVLILDGSEVGRITGYPGADFFWAQLGELMRKLPVGNRA